MISSKQAQVIKNSLLLNTILCSKSLSFFPKGEIPMRHLRILHLLFSQMTFISSCPISWYVLFKKEKVVCQATLSNGIHLYVKGKEKRE